MIGGFDIVIRTTSGVVGLNCCLHIARSLWPNAVFEDARQEAAAGTYRDLQFDGLDEVFIYRDAEAAREWDELGAEPHLANTMIHVLCSPQSVTIVVDDPEQSEMADFLAAAREHLLIWDIPERLAA